MCSFKRANQMANEMWARKCKGIRATKVYAEQKKKNEHDVCVCKRERERVKSECETEMLKWRIGNWWAGERGGGCLVGWMRMQTRVCRAKKNDGKRYCDRSYSQRFFPSDCIVYFNSSYLFIFFFSHVKIKL